MVNDMLFLSQADRGATARRGAPVSLAALARQVVEFHEAPLEEARLGADRRRCASSPVDEPLFKRAVSNLLGNATRFAEPGSRDLVRIAPDAPDQVQVVVQNAGRRSSRSSCRACSTASSASRSARADSEAHHGLGLAIVAAIARMHAGRAARRMRRRHPRIGFTVAAH